MPSGRFVQPAVYGIGVSGCPTFCSDSSGKVGWALAAHAFSGCLGMQNTWAESAHPTTFYIANQRNGTTRADAG